MYRYKMQDKQKDKRNLIIDLLVVLFGVGTWIGVNGVFIELPLFVEKAPEGWSLPSYLSIMVQLGNIGPLAYTLLQHFSPSTRIKRDSYLIYCVLFIGGVAVILTAFLSDKTAVVSGREHSVALFSLMFLIAMHACTSSVLFMPYMGRFKEKYMVTYFLGEGLSGLLPSLAALIQGVGGKSECKLVNVTETGEEIYEKYKSPPLFGTTEYFIFVFAMILCSILGFTLLDHLKLAKKQYANISNAVVETDDQNVMAAAQEKEVSENASEAKSISVSDLIPTGISKMQYKGLLILMAIISFFANGIFNSIQPYSTLPYGVQAYHLTATLSVIANPFACLLAVFFAHANVNLIFTLTSISSLLTAYVFTTSVMSSSRPPLQGTSAGSAIIVICWTVLIALISYIKLGITTAVRAKGKKALVWVGGVTQLGSLIGSILIFCLINYTKIFQATPEEEC